MFWLGGIVTMRMKRETVVYIQLPSLGYGLVTYIFASGTYLRHGRIKKDNANGAIVVLPRSAVMASGQAPGF